VSSSPVLTRGRAWWLARIETRTARRLQQLRQRELWDGCPPVPVEHVIEHLLELSISYEDIEEHPEEEVLGSFRPETREIVLNARHIALFRDIPGRRRFTLAHEAGHADLYALAECAAQGELALLGQYYHPRMKPASRGPVAVLSLQLARRLRALPAPQRDAVYRRICEAEHARYAAGHDTPLVRRTVDTYASMLLMPAELVRTQAAGQDLTVYAEIKALAEVFAVSATAMRYRLLDLRLVFEGPDRTLVRTDPTHVDQGELFPSL
jgi:hypothetical protein